MTLPPAAARTISEFFDDTNTNTDDYDLVLTGNLGCTGTELLHELLHIEYGKNIERVHGDCGLMIFDLKKQDVNSGGSGYGCSAPRNCDLQF